MSRPWLRSGVGGPRKYHGVPVGERSTFNTLDVKTLVTEDKKLVDGYVFVSEERDVDGGGTGEGSQSESETIWI